MMASVDWKKTNALTLARMGAHFDNSKREVMNHSNADIDRSKTADNYYLGCDSWGDLLDKSKNFINEMDEKYPPKKKQNPEDRVTMVALEVPCPREITDAGLSQLFFENMDALFRERYGRAYTGMAVHVDEVHTYLDHGEIKTSCEHGHAFVCAYAEWEQATKRGTELRKGINGKNFETRSHLNELNKAVDEMCVERFGVHYNTGAPARRRSVEELKVETIIEMADKMADQRRQMWQLEQEKIDVKKELATKQREIAKAEMEMEQITIERDHIRTESAALKKENTALIKEKDAAEKEVNRTKKRLKELKPVLKNIIYTLALGTHNSCADFLESAKNQIKAAGYNRDYELVHEIEHAEKGIEHEIDELRYHIKQLQMPTKEGDPLDTVFEDNARTLTTIKSACKILKSVWEALFKSFQLGKAEIERDIAQSRLDQAEQYSKINDTLANYDDEEEEDEWER